MASVWIPQIPDDFDALTAATIVAAETSRIEIGTAVVPVQTRHPIALAQQALSVQAVCKGRLALGLGVSHHWVIDEMLGLPYEHLAPTMRANLDVLDQALAGPGMVDVENDYFRVHNPLDITDVTPDAGAAGRAGSDDAAAGRRAHRRHHPVDGRRAGHRLARRAEHHPRRRGGRPTRAAGGGRHPGVPVPRRRDRRRHRPHQPGAVGGRDLAQLPAPARARRRPRRWATSWWRAASRPSRSACGASPTPASPTCRCGWCRSARAATSSSPRRSAPARCSRPSLGPS